MNGAGLESTVPSMLPARRFYLCLIMIITIIVCPGNLQSSIVVDAVLVLVPISPKHVARGVNQCLT